MGELPHQCRVLWIRIRWTFGSGSAILNYGFRYGFGVRIRILTIYQRFEEISEKYQHFIMSANIFFKCSQKFPGRFRILPDPYPVVKWPPGSGSVILDYGSAAS
jgi:hypothetical protein